jgi:hypothetical protein
MIDIHFICRECGTPCNSEAARDRGGLCSRCAFPTRVTVRTFQLAIDREQAVSTALESAAQAIDAVALPIPFTPSPDPFRRAIDRAFAAWAEDEFGDGPDPQEDNCTGSYP